MLKISSVKRINVNDYQSSLPVNRNFEIAIAIAQVFSSSFDGYDAFVLEYSFSDSSKVIFPIVKIKSGLSIHASLPYSWKTHFLYSCKEDLTHKFNLIIQNSKAHFIHISLPDLQSCDFKEALLNSKLKSDFYCSYITPLKSRTFDEIFKNDFSSKTRNQCRKALKSGVKITRSKLREDVEKYFDIYTETTQKWSHEYNPYPLTFFEQLVALEHVDFWTAYSEDIFLGGIIVIKYDNWVYYWSGMTDRKYSSLCANNGLLNEAIQYYCSGNFEYFDYGPSEGLGNVDKFKRGFGPKEIKHYTFEYESKSYKYILKPISNLKKGLLK